MERTRLSKISEILLGRKNKTESDIWQVVELTIQILIRSILSWTVLPEVEGGNLDSCGIRVGRQVQYIELGD